MDFKVHISITAARAHQRTVHSRIDEMLTGMVVSIKTTKNVWQDGIDPPFLINTVPISAYHG